MANIMVAKGPIRDEIGMNDGTNVMGPHREANSGMPPDLSFGLRGDLTHTEGFSERNLLDIIDPAQPDLSFKRIYADAQT